MTARIAPVSLEDADEETRELLKPLSRVRGADTRVLNVFGTLGHHPELLRHWLVFAGYLLSKSTLPARLRELVVLRVGWRCNSPYEWGQHVWVGRRAGVDDADLARIVAGPDAGGWSDAERAALRAADELIDRHTVTDVAWQALTENFTTQQVLDLVFLVGQYQLVSAALNACRVERDDGLDTAALPFPARAE